MNIIAQLGRLSAQQMCKSAQLPLPGQRDNLGNPDSYGPPPKSTAPTGPYKNRPAGVWGNNATFLGDPFTAVPRVSFPKENIPFPPEEALPLDNAPVDPGPPLQINQLQFSPSAPSLEDRVKQMMGPTPFKPVGSR